MARYSDDALASEFMSSSGATYLAADRLPHRQDHDGQDEMEVRRQELMRKMRETETRTEQSSRNCLSAIYEAEKVGIETAEELVKQREQLENTDRRLDTINSTLKDTQKDIKGIQSVFSSLRNWWSAPKAKGKKGDNNEEDKEEEEKKPVPSPSANPNLGSAYQTSHQSVAHQMKTTHPTLRLKELEYDEALDEMLDVNLHSYTQNVNNRLDNNLDAMSHGLSNLRSLAVGLGSEIEDQNQILDRLQPKIIQTDLSLGAQNTQMKALLKR